MRGRALAVAAVVLGLAGPVAAQQPVDDDAAAAPGGAVDVDGGAGPGVDAGVGAGVAPGGPDAGPVIVDGPALADVARPQASASAAPSQLQLGETLTLFVEVVFDERITVNLPSTLDLGDSFDELRRTSRDEVRSDGTRKRIYQLELRAWELGELQLPPIQIGYSAGAERSWVVTNPVPLRILGLLGDVDDKTALVGETPPMALRRRDWRWLLVGAVMLSLIVVGLVARWWRRRQPNPVATAIGPAPVRAARVRLSGAAERALAALTALEKAGTLASDPRAGYEQLVAILRRFWHEQFAVGIRDRTSAELLRVLRRTAMPASVLAASGRWLERCDLVKYAAAEPDAETRTADLAGARELVVAALAPPSPASPSSSSGGALSSLGGSGEVRP